MGEMRGPGDDPDMPPRPAAGTDPSTFFNNEEDNQHVRRSTRPRTENRQFPAGKLVLTEQNIPNCINFAVLENYMLADDPVVVIPEVLGGRGRGSRRGRDRGGRGSTGGKASRGRGARGGAQGGSGGVVVQGGDGHSDSGSSSFIPPPFVPPYSGPPSSGPPLNIPSSISLPQSGPSPFMATLSSHPQSGPNFMAPPTGPPQVMTTPSVDEPATAGAGKKKVERK
jgi:hypothetical protein